MAEAALPDELPPLEEGSALKTWVVRGLVLAVLVGVGWMAWRKWRGGQAPVRRLTVVKVERGDLAETVTASGTVYPVNQVDVGSQVSGTISEILTDRNRTVTAGDIIARLEASRYETALAQAQAAAAVATADLERTRVSVREADQNLARARTLVERGAGTSVEVDSASIAVDRAHADVKAAQARVSQAWAAVKTARVDLDRTVIRAPISGIVIKRSIEVGQTVAASLQAPVLFQIAQGLGEMEVRAAVDQADIAKLDKGMPASVTVPGVRVPLDATVFDIWLSPTVTQTVVTYDVILRVKNPDGKLLPQMTANVKVTTAQRSDVVKVPNAALRFKPPADIVEGGGEVAKTEPPKAEAPKGARPPGAGARPRGDRAPPKVYVKVDKGDGKPWVRALPVQVGISDGSFTEIISGLEAGVEVVTELRTGKKKDAPSPQPQGPPRGGLRRM